jgi:hypothetical protein
MKMCFSFTITSGVELKSSVGTYLPHSIWVPSTSLSQLMYPSASQTTSHLDPTLLILDLVFNPTEPTLTSCTTRHYIQTKSKSNIYKPNLYSYGTITYLSRAYFTKTISNHTTTLNLDDLLLKSLIGEPTSTTEPISYTIASKFLE